MTTTGSLITGPHLPRLRLLVSTIAPFSQRRLTSWKKRCAAEAAATTTCAVGQQLIHDRIGLSQTKNLPTETSLDQPTIA